MAGARSRATVALGDGWWGVAEDLFLAGAERLDGRDEALVRKLPGVDIRIVADPR